MGKTKTPEHQEVGTPLFLVTYSLIHQGESASAQELRVCSYKSGGELQGSDNKRSTLDPLFDLCVPASTLRRSRATCLPDEHSSLVFAEGAMRGMSACSQQTPGSCCEQRGRTERRPGCHPAQKVGPATGYMPGIPLAAPSCFDIFPVETFSSTRRR